MRTKMIAHIRLVGGSANGSIPVRCIIRKPGRRVTVLNNPTNPKKSDILTRASSPILFFIIVV